MINYSLSSLSSLSFYHFVKLINNILKFLERKFKMNPRQDLKNSLLTLSEVANYLKVSEDDILNEIKSYQLFAKQIGGLIIIRKVDLIRYLNRPNIGLNFEAE